MLVQISRQRRDGPVVVVGTGMAGLCAALCCSARGLPVVMFESAPTPGGKIMQHGAAPRPIDVGPTVLTMRWVFEAMFAACGLTFGAHVRTVPLALLARHFWPDGAQIDLHSDMRATEDAVGHFAGAAAARGYRAFCRYSERLYETVREPFICGPKPSWRNVWQGRSLGELAGLLRIDAHVSMHRRLERFFAQPRLLQLFGRYATYCGGSPYLTPATLNLVAHVEREGVWRVEGGMGALARAVAAAAQGFGTRIYYDTPVARVLHHAGAAVGVQLADGSEVDACAVIVNGGPRAATALLCGEVPARRGALSPRPVASARREPVALSAVTCSWSAQAAGASLAHHNVFFSDDYAAEFQDVFARRRLPAAPSIYVCAADRSDRTPAAGSADERIFSLINAPTGLPPKDTPCSEEIRHRLADRGLTLTPRGSGSVMSPADFAQRFPHTDGALYGAAPHSWRAFFARAGSRCSLAGLYVCGGSVHPGPGLPMVALSGQQAALALAADFGLMSPSRPAVTAGGTSTPKAMTAPARFAPSSS